VITSMRVLSIVEVHVNSEQRSDYLTGLAATRAAASAAHAHFWVFENEEEPGRFVEFTEGSDAASVASVHGGVMPKRALWREVQGA
jgi:hypothetical protein